MRRTPQSEPPSMDGRRDNELKIIGGTFRGRVLAYHGDPVTRPMKHRVREAIFNLISTEAEGRRVIDVFAGTGALGLEALSRGAAEATFIERHVPTSRIIRENIESLAVEDRSTLLGASAFVWGKRDLATFAQSSALSESTPWLVFVSPPYDFFVDRQEELLELISALAHHAPTGSALIVESDARFDIDLLKAATQGDLSSFWMWDVRTYLPAVIAVGRKRVAEEPPENTSSPGANLP